jgi:hypothetical protein
MFTFKGKKGKNTNGSSFVKNKSSLISSKLLFNNEPFESLLSLYDPSISQNFSCSGTTLTLSNKLGSILFFTKPKNNTLLRSGLNDTSGFILF